MSQTDTSLAPSLFQNHQLQVHAIKPVIHYTSYDYVVAAILFLSFTVFVWLYVSNAKRLDQLIRGFYSNRSNNQLSRDEYSVTNRVGVLLSLLFLFTISLFIGQVVEHLGLKIQMRKTAMYASIVISLIVMYSVKTVLIRFSGFVFKTSKEAVEYASTMFIFLNILGLFMLPIVICLAFVKQINPDVFIYTGYFIILSFLCVRLIRGLVIGFNSNRVSKFYLFLYLCTLEIIPFIILVKLFRIYIG
jgi:hypothetical protein